MRAPLILLCLAAGLAIVVAIANPNVHPAASPAPVGTAPAGMTTAAANRDAATGQLVLQRCGACHDLQVLSQNPQDAAGWQETVALMQQMGAQVNPQESNQIVDYLARHFPASH